MNGFIKWYINTIHRHVLRTRLILGLLVMLILLISMGLYSIQSTSELRDMMEKTKQEDYKAVVVMQKIKLATALINSAVAMKLSPAGFDGSDVYEQNRKLLEENYAALNKLILSPNESQIRDVLRSEIRAYLDSSRLYFTTAGFTQVSLQRELDGFLNQGIGIVGKAEQIIALQQEEIVNNSTAAQDAGKRTIRLLLLGMIMAVMISIYASYRMGKGIIVPIDTLRNSVRKIGEGDLDLMLPVNSNDELGDLSTAFNDMVGQLRTYRNSASEKILLLNKTIQTTFDAFLYPVFVLDPKGKIELKNSAAIHFLEKLNNQNRAPLPDEIMKKVGAVLESKKDYVPSHLKDALNFYLDDEQKYYLPHLLLLSTEKDEIFGIAVILEDVTRQRLVDDIKSNLIATVSHELKTPMTSIRMAIHLLIEEKIGQLNPKQVELLHAARDDSERLLKMLNNLLDLTVLEEAHLKLNFLSCDIRELLEVALTEVKKMAKSKNISLALDIEESLPKIKADCDRIHHIFVNLLTNAIKHSPESEKIVLYARKAEADGIVRIGIIDRGPGIAVEHQKRIFDKFYRVPGQKKTGAGLGLSIAQEIIRAHGSKIKVISEVGKGSEFYIEMPGCTEGCGQAD